MLEWGIRNIITITVDNAIANDTALEYVKRRTCSKEGAILESQFMHMRCCAHILNLIVTKGLKEVDDSIVRVRSAVKYMKSSPARFKKFKVVLKENNLLSRVCCVLMFKLDETLHFLCWKVLKNVKLLSNL